MLDYHGSLLAEFPEHQDIHLIPHGFQQAVPLRTPLNVEAQCISLNSWSPVDAEVGLWDLFTISRDSRHGEFDRRIIQHTLSEW